MSTQPAVHLIQADTVAPQPWRNGGGQTRELLAWPDAQRWRLRISRADIEADGPFSAFADVQRWFEVLSGNGVVLRMPTPDQHSRDHHLLPGHSPLHFDGALAPYCQLKDGPTQDLNLMARGGDACMRAVEPDEAWRPSHTMCGLYTVAPGVWTDGTHRQALGAHCLLWMPQAPATPMRFAPANTDTLRAYWLGFTPEAAP